jgi:hypothetical protein
METIAAWHDYVRTRDPARLDGLIAEDCVFESPALHGAQAGKALTIHYLTAAVQVLGNDRFHYAEQWHGDRSAVLEFATVLDGLTVNGVDIIHWGADGRITGFKVMVRPLRALSALVERMRAALTPAA